jgi:amidase
VDITIADQGVTTTLSEIGPLFDKVETRTKIIPIEDGKAIFNDIEFPVNTMIGVIGVAPKEGSIPCGHWGLLAVTMSTPPNGQGKAIMLKSLS